MEPLYGVALARQYDAVIAMLDQALVACPAALWTERLWPTLPPAHFPPPFAEFWYVSFHALVWLDLYLQGIPEEAFAPPASFTQGEIDSVATLPDRPYARDALGIVPAFVRQAITGRWRPVATLAEPPAIRGVDDRVRQRMVDRIGRGRLSAAMQGVRRCSVSLRGERTDRA